MRNTKLSSLTLWLALFGTAVPFACSSSECDGPGGLCINAPSGGDGEPGGAGAGSGGSSEGGAPQGGSGVDGGSPSPGGSDGMGGVADGGEPNGTGGSGRGGTGGGSSGRGGSSGTDEGGEGGEGGEGAAGRAGGAATGGTAGTGGTGVTEDPLCAPRTSFTDSCGSDPGAGGEGGGGSPGWCDAPTTSIEALGPPGGAGGRSGLGGASFGGMGGSISIGGTTVGGRGFGGTGVGGGPGFTLFPIDDLEDGDSFTLPVFGGRGVWYTANSGMGLQFPKSCPNTTTTAAQGIFPVPGGHAMHTYGRDFFEYAILGLSFRLSTPECDRPIDASRAAGVRFRAKGVAGSSYPQSIIFTVLTVATNPPHDGGTCTIEPCYQGFDTSIGIGPDWEVYLIPFVSLPARPGVPFDPATILNISWSWNHQHPCFDFWIDDVAFYANE